MTRLRQSRSPFKKAFVAAWRSYSNFHEYSEYKIWYASLIGMISFPAFYYVWTALVPQSYESMRLRIIGSALCFGLALADYWPTILRPYRVAFSYVTFVYSLPFFFTFMMLMNEGSTVWLLSALAALMYLVFLIDEVTIVPATIVGTLLATLAYFSAAAAPTFATPLITAVPILVFTFMGMLLLNHGTNRIVDEKLKAARTLAGYIAHEMRTPLASMRLDAQTIAGMVTILSEAFTFARLKGFDAPHVRPEKISLLEETCGRIVAQANSANAVIDALLMNLSEAAQPGRSAGAWGIQSMRETLNQVLRDGSLNYDTRAVIDVLQDRDFQYLGSRDLMCHVLFNLLRNAVRAAEETSGSVTVELLAEPRWNSIIVADSGPGIPHKVLSHLFTPFRTFNRDSGGSGLGLAFCRLVVENMGGAITCTSEAGQGAVFTIRLPVLPVPHGLAAYQPDENAAADVELAGEFARTDPLKPQ